MLPRMTYALVVASVVLAFAGDIRMGPELGEPEARNTYSTRPTVRGISPQGYFIENVGQHGNRSIRYYIQHPGLQVGFSDEEIRFEVFDGSGPERPGSKVIARQVQKAAAFSLKVGSRNVRPKAVERSTSSSNYYVGPNSDRWYTDVPHYKRLVYEDVYPGIDLVYFFSEQGQLTFEYHVNPGADPSQIELRYTGTNGMELRADGAAVARTPAGLLLHGRPLSYQARERGREIVRSRFQISGPDSFGVKFPLGYDSSRKLVVDPTLTFATYWGSGGGANRTVAIDGAGNIYMSGGATSKDWPTTDGSSHHGHFDVTVAKFDSNGRLLWSTLLGGPAEDYAYVSAVSAEGELYVAGRAGEGFPTTPGAFDRTFRGGKGDGPHKPADAFVVKLSREGKLVYSTYIGGNGNEAARAIHLLPSGKLIVGGGNTTATDMPTSKGTLGGPVLKPKRGGFKDGWVAVVAADGKSLDFLTYFGPSDGRNMRGDETIRALGVDGSANIWIGGTTQGSDMVPTADAFQKVRGRGSEGYIAKLSPDGKKLVYFSWLGGKDDDEIETEGVSDAAGNFYVAGSTGSSDFPTTPGAFQTMLKANSAGWVAKINNNGSLGFATFYGGTKGDEGVFFGPVVDLAGNVYCTGSIRSKNIPVTKDAFQRQGAGGSDAVLVIISPDGKRLLYGSYFGGSADDSARHIAIHPNGRAVCIIGETDSTDLPLLNALQTVRSEFFLAMFVLP